MKQIHENPFPSGDPDRHAIWEMLVERDITSFLAQEWSSVRDDFAEDRFVGYSGASNPDHWRMTYPSLDTYRDEWLRQAQSFASTQLSTEDKAAFLFRVSVLRDIEIRNDRAAAHKKIEGRALAVDGSEITLNWQTLYWLQRLSGRWKVVGFLGYLPNPMPEGGREAQKSQITMPLGAIQHKTAGPYSPVLRVDCRGLVAISGQGPIDDAGATVGETFAEQSVMTLENCKRQLEAASASFSDVFKVVVYLADISNWEVFNEIYRRYFGTPYPVRTAIQAVLYQGIQIEIDMFAVSR
jgi:enamine deaminase RidA (YjgF/YER057c/UK114 family)